MATKSEAAYHHGDLKRALIQEALVMIAESGASELSLRELARRVGVTQTAPYRHFADREALLAVVAEEGFRILTSKSKTAASGAASNLEALSAIGREYIKFARENPSHYRVMFGPDLIRSDRNTRYPSLNQLCDALDVLLIDLIVEGQNAGEINDGPPAELAESTWALVHGLSSLLIDGHIGRNIESAFKGQDTIAFALKQWHDKVFAKKPG